MLSPRHHPGLLFAENTILVVIDMQDSLLGAVCRRDSVTNSVCTLIQGMAHLRVPVLSTTQMREKLGEINPQVKRVLPGLLPPFDKRGFSCESDMGFRSELQRSGRKQVLLCGVESHICVCQTALELAASGFQPHVVVDAVTSRTEENRQLGIDKMRQAGVMPASVESALYELLVEAGTPEFKAVLQLIK